MTPAEIDSLIIALEDVIFYHRKLDPKVPHDCKDQAPQMRQRNFNERERWLESFLNQVREEREGLYE